MAGTMADGPGRRWSERLHATGAHALYLHLPFCARKCAYCDFVSWATEARDPLMGAYLSSLSSQLRELSSVGLLDDCATAYVGGGTPTLAGEGLPALVETMRGHLPRLRELSCEANPESLGDELLAALAEAGCTRLSLGVQSLDEGELEALGRIHRAATALERLEAAVTSGLEASCDLMCATPGQDDESWRRTLAQVIGAGVPHVSVYPLQIEPDTPLGRRHADKNLAWNDPELQARRMELACELLSRAGLERYEVASYARPGHACRHNESYWTGVPYLGLGCGASSMLTREGYLALRHLAHQLPELPDEAARIRLSCVSSPRELAASRSIAELRFEGELLDARQAAAEDLMLGMRLVRGVPASLLAHARELLGPRELDEALGWCESRGLVRPGAGSWEPTEQGWLMGNELFGRLWELAPGRVRSL